MPTRHEIAAWLERIDDARRYTNFGPLSHAFESALLQRFAPVPAPYLTTVANATLGLELALAALDLPRQSPVLVPAFTFVATATAIVRAGLVPVIADVDADSWLLTPQIAREALKTCAVRATLPVAALGCTQPVSQWDGFTAETGIPVVIDAAPALDSQPIGRTTAAVYSLHATKNIGVGEGGIVAAADRGFVARVRASSNFGLEDGEVRHAGTNAKLSEYHCAVGLAMLRRWEERRAAKRKLLDEYRRGLDALRRPLFHQGGSELVISTVLAIRLPDLDVAALAERLRDKGIQTRRWYYPPLHGHRAFADAPRAGALANAERLGREILGLPFHLHMTREDIDYTISWLDRSWA